MCRLAVNRWAVGRIAALVGRLDQALAEYKFNEAAHAVYHGIWGEFCDWYLEFAKPIFAGADAAAKAETRAAVAWCLGRLLHLLHPFMPFITEELWQQVLERSDPLIVAPWPVLSASLIDEKAAGEIGWVVDLVSEVRALRAEMNVAPGAEVAAFIRDAGPKLASYRELIERLARIRIQETGEAPAGAVQLVVGSATVLLSLAGHLDIARERSRIQKDIDRSAGEAGKAEKKLANRDFVAKAPAEVVEGLRERLAEENARRDKLGVALQRLNALTGS